MASSMAALLVLCLLIPGLIPESPVAPTRHPSVVMLEINPSVIFSVDENGIVSNVVATNADADVILSDPERLSALEGILISDALKHFVDFAAQFGYLDLSQQSVVRISSCVDEQVQADDQLVDSLKDDLETYFQKSGAYIAVVAERLNLQDFCRQANVVQAENLEMFLQGIKDMPAFYFDRHKDLWEQSYEQAVAVQSRLDELLAVLLSSSEISDQMKKFFADNMTSHLEIICSLLQLDTEKIKFFETPATYEEYLERIRVHCEEMAEIHKESYEKPRQELSSDDYAAYIESIIEQYGSLEAYWENKK